MGSLYMRVKLNKMATQQSVESSNMWIGSLELATNGPVVSIWLKILEQDLRHASLSVFVMHNIEEAYFFAEVHMPEEQAM